MNNEEKANQIAQQCDFTTNARDIDIAFKAAMKMSQWKDEQFDKAKENIFNMACDAYCDGCPSHEGGYCTVAWGVCDNYCSFHEKFKERLKKLK